MQIKRAIEQAKGKYITNGKKTFRVAGNNMFYDRNYNQVTLFNTNELFIDNWKIINLTTVNHKW